MTQLAKTNANRHDDGWGLGAEVGGTVRQGMSRAGRSHRLFSGLDDIRLLAVVAIASAASIYTWPALISPLWPLLLLPVVFWSVPGRWLVVGAALTASWTLFDADQRMSSRWPAVDEDAVVWVTGRVVGLPEPDAFRTRFRLLTDDDARLLRLSWYDDAPVVQAGDCLRLKVKLSTPHGSANPGQFDYTAWLWREGIDATGYVREAGTCELPPLMTLDRLRGAALDRLAPAIEGSPMRGIIEALTLGVRQHITDAQWTTLRATGTSHLVAISGLHIGLIAGLLFVLARWLALRSPALRHARAVACLAAFAGALGYAALAGWALPTQRALIMVAVGLLAVASERSISAGRALAWAALIVVVASPPSVTTAGFWLSFSAVAWLIWLSSIARGPLWLRWLWFQAGLLLALTPITLWFFSQASLAAPLVNAVLIPASTIGVPLVLGVALLALIWPVGGGLLLSWLASALAYGWHGLAWIADWQGAAFDYVPGSVAVISMAIAGMAWLALPLPRRLRVLGMVMVLPLVLGYRPGEPSIGHGHFEATVLDVGQGLSVVVQTTHHVLVFDAGPAFRTGFDAGEMIVVPYLRQRAIPRVDALMISHDDNDHIGGAAAVARALPVQRRLGAGGTTPCRAGMTWSWEGVRFVVVYPDADQARAAAGDNDRSCVLRVSTDEASLLLTGDIEAAGERAMLDARSPAELASDVLVVPHHGSASSSTAALLSTVSPAMAIVSAGWHNQWGFPRPEIVTRYARRGIPLINTARSGAITVRWSDSGQPTVSRWREAHARFWQQPMPVSQAE